MPLHINVAMHFTKLACQSTAPLNLLRPSQTCLPVSTILHHFYPREWAKTALRHQISFYQACKSLNNLLLSQSQSQLKMVKRWTKTTARSMMILVLSQSKISRSRLSDMPRITFQPQILMTELIIICRLLVAHQISTLQTWLEETLSNTDIWTNSHSKQIICSFSRAYY